MTGSLAPQNLFRWMGGNIFIYYFNQFTNHLKAEVIMYQANQQSASLQNQLNEAPSAFPLHPHKVFKLNILSPKGKINAIYVFANITELKHFIELNQPPRYEIWG